MPFVNRQMLLDRIYDSQWNPDESPNPLDVLETILDDKQTAAFENALIPPEVIAAQRLTVLDNAARSLDSVGETELATSVREVAATTVDAKLVEDLEP